VLARFFTLALGLVSVRVNNGKAQLTSPRRFEYVALASVERDPKGDDYRSLVPGAVQFSP
jgi:hypothetical protein